MSKGEARAAQKRQSKILRAAQLAKEKAEAKAAERAAKAGNSEATQETGTGDENLSEAEKRTAMMSKAAEEERSKRKELRKANKEAIKARNFVSAS